MRTTIAIGLLFAGLAAPALDSSPAPAKSYNVREFGAKGDGATLDTAAIQKALDECGKSGGTVQFPAGTYLSKPIVLRGRTTLRLDAGAILKATDDPQDFLKPGLTWTTWDSITSGNQFVPFISGEKLSGAAIVGPGTIDGSGAKWWVPAEEARRKRPGYTLPRPNLIVLSNCRDLRVAKVKLINSPKFHFVPTDCENVVIEDVTIFAPEHAANTDGIDPSRCRNVTISRCTIDTGDDNIALKSGRKVEGREFACDDITVSDCVFLHGHGMSIGAETVGGVRRLTVRNCRFENTENGIRIKSRRDRGGRVEDITYSNLTMTNVRSPISIACYYQDSSQAKFPKDDPAQPVTATTPKFARIRISNVTATGGIEAGLVVGLPESLVSDVVLNDVRIAAGDGLTLANARGVQLRNVVVDAKQGEPFLLHNAQVEGLPAGKK